MILYEGRVAAERWGGGFDRHSLFEIGSIRKSFNCALLGIAHAEHGLSFDLNAGLVWPELVEISGNPKDRAATLHHLASGTSGWLTPDPPGRAFLYNNAAFTAAERVLARFMGWPRDETAAEVTRRFREPLKAESWHVRHWDRPFVAASHEDPGPKLAIDSTLPDLMKWGQLWLQQGRWQGAELFPAAHAALATRPTNPHLPDAHYGYNWFINDRRVLWPAVAEQTFGHGGTGTFTPSGLGNRSFLCVVPSLHLVLGAIAQAGVGIGIDRLADLNGYRAQWLERVAACLA
jgi:CubicO group peptidase (beta-lactamase class C family)